jgi:hypothetical protein
MYLFASSLTAALLDDLFDHPASYPPAVPKVRTSEIQACPSWNFPQPANPPRSAG